MEVPPSLNLDLKYQEFFLLLKVQSSVVMELSDNLVSQ
jgi:hypothetical protein